jgi:hypothetical protein
LRWFEGRSPASSAGLLLLARSANIILGWFLLTTPSFVDGKPRSGSHTTQPGLLLLEVGTKGTGDRADEGLSGIWKQEGDSAVINWDTGWVTKIVKRNEKF